MEVVKSILDKQRAEQAQFKTITVEKQQEVAFDVGHLMASINDGI